MDKTFENCVSLKEFDFKGIIDIYGYAFENCISLKEIKIEDARQITHRAFYNCTGLEEVIIITSVKRSNVILLSFSSFNGCNNLKRIYVQGLFRRLIYSASESIDGISGAMIYTDLQEIDLSWNSGCNDFDTSKVVLNYSLDDFLKLK